MAKDIIKNIPLTLDINAGKRSEGTVDISLYSKDISTGQFEFTFINEDEEPVVLDETYSAQALVKYEDEEKIYLDDMIIEGNIIRFIFPHDFITKDGIVTVYVYITKDNYTSDVAAISFNVYRSEIDDIATDIVTTYDKNYEDILAEFEQALEDYKLTLPQADSVRADIDEILNQATNQAVADWKQDADALLETVEGNESARVDAETTRKTAETDRVSSETTRKTNETTRISNENARKSAESVRVSNEEVRELNEAERISKDSERDSKIDGKANKSMLLSPKYDLVYDSCVRDVDTSLDAYSVPMESGHFFENVEDRDSDTTLTYEPDGVLLVAPSSRNDLSPVLIENFDVDFPHFDVRAKHLSVDYDTRFWFIKYKDKDNWVAIKIEEVYQNTAVTTSVEGIQTEIATENLSYTEERQARPEAIYSLKAEIIRVHTRFAETRNALRVFKNEQWVFTVPIPINVVDFPNRVGFSVGSRTEILNFKAGRSS